MYDIFLFLDMYDTKTKEDIETYRKELRYKRSPQTQAIVDAKFELVEYY